MTLKLVMTHEDYCGFFLSRILFFLRVCVCPLSVITGVTSCFSPLCKVLEDTKEIFSESR